MSNESRCYLTLLVVTVLLLASSVLSCDSSTNSSSNDELSIKSELTQELWQSLMDYNLELAGVEQIRKESLDQIDEALKAGDISTLKFRKRAYEIILIEANTIKYIDRKPEYALLHTFMWEGGKAPGLAWSIPELERDSEKREAEFEDYLQIYIVRHYDVVEDFSQILRQRADELGIDLTYTPGWLK